MLKILLTAAGLAFAATPALADGLPKPPTEKYSAPETPSCAATSVRVYFRNGDTALSEASRRAIKAAADQLEGCALASVDMVSLASDGRSVNESSALAVSRAAIVKSVLGDQGLSTPDTTVRYDEAYSTAPVQKPMARRVEVVLAGYRPEIG